MTSDQHLPTTYQGRRLNRPDEELTDQGLSFDIATVFTRRRALLTFGLGAAAVGLAACGSAATPTATPSASASGAGSSGVTEIPEETAGPYPGDGSNGPDVLEEDGIIRSDIRSSFGDASGTAEGVPIELELTILDLAKDGAPFVGVAVYVWHCTREGGYSLYSEGVTDQNYLRGVQIADDQGKVRFTSIFPACYSGRWPHIHFEVYPDRDSITDDALVIATSQVALPEDVCQTVYAETGYEASVATLAQVSLADDNVFGDDEGATQLATVTGDVVGGYSVAHTVGVDTATTPTGGQASGDGRPSGAPGGTPPSGMPSGGPGGSPPSGPPPSGAASAGS